MMEQEPQTYKGVLGILEGARWHLPPCDLSPGVRLRAPQPSEVTALDQVLRRYHRLRKDCTDACLLEVMGDIPSRPIIDRPQDAALEMADYRLEIPLLLLRLFKEGPLGLSLAVLMAEAEPRYDPLQLNYLPLIRHHGQPPTYSLTAEEIPQLQSWFARPWADSLMGKPGVRWFMRSYTETYDEHRALQLIFGLEQILLYREQDPSNKRYKFALRGAWLLGSRLEERCALLTDLKRLYDLRSEIVHGRESSEIDPDDQRLIRKADELFRSLLRLTLLTGNEVNTQKWDRAILSAGANED